MIGVLAWGDAGVLIPSTAKQPDPKVLTLDEMTIAIVIDNGNAKVKVQQIFANPSGQPIEGNYVFALPGRALVSDFRDLGRRDAHPRSDSRTQTGRGNL